MILTLPNLKKLLTRLASLIKSIIILIIFGCVLSTVQARTFIDAKDEWQTQSHRYAYNLCAGYVACGNNPYFDAALRAFHPQHHQLCEKFGVTYIETDFRTEVPEENDEIGVISNRFTVHCVCVLADPNCIFLTMSNSNPNLNQKKKGQSKPKIAQFSKKSSKNMAALVKHVAHSKVSHGPHIKGHGFYNLSTLKNMVTSAGHHVKRAAHSVWKFLKPSLGIGAKAVLSHFAKKVSGHGDYYFNGSPLSSLPGAQFLTGSSPSFSSHGDETVITHREFIGTLTGSTAFSLQSYHINPTNSSLFPWLAQIAINYQEFKMDGMLLEIGDTSADALNSTNTALGNVIVATNYDVDAPNFADQATMENFEGAESYKPSQSFIYPIECAAQETPVKIMYTTTASDDQRLSYLGNLQIATVGMQAAAVIAKVYVIYKIRLYKPKLPTPASNVDFLHVSNFGSTILTTNPFGTNPAISARGCFFGSTVAINGGDRVVNIPKRLRPGVYLIIEAISSATSATTFSPLMDISAAHNNIATPLVLSKRTAAQALCQASAGANQQAISVTFRSVLDDGALPALTGATELSQLYSTNSSNSWTPDASSRYDLLVFRVTNDIINGSANSPASSFLCGTDVYPSLSDGMISQIRDLISSTIHQEEEKWVEPVSPIQGRVSGYPTTDISNSTLMRALGNLVTSTAK